jgi:hypothetical protein
MGMRKAFDPKTEGTVKISFITHKLPPKRTPLKVVSPKHSRHLRTYNEVRGRLLELAGGKSELSGIQGDNSISGRLSPHHITGRGGAKLTNPFNIIWLLEREHWIAQSEMSWENKQTLLDFIKPVRISQGFNPDDYEPLCWHAPVIIWRSPQ